MLEYASYSKFSWEKADMQTEVVSILDKKMDE